MAHLLYNALLHLALPWVWVRLFWKAGGAYRSRIGERFGRVPPEVPGGALWFHAVSVGETNAAAPLVDAVARRFPGEAVLVTTTTPTGSARVRVLLGDAVAHCYAPYDYPWAVRRFLAVVRPKALVLMETELWPNLIAQASRAGTAVYLVNARLSERSFHGYRRIGALSHPMLRRLRGVACQYEDTAERLRRLGARQVEVTGSVKFDAEPPPDHFGVQELPHGEGPVWIAGSTHPGEEAILLDAHRRLAQRFPRLRLVLAPRHTERVAAVSRLARGKGLTTGLLSHRALDAQVLVADVMGTLPHLYGLADVAFVGGSLNRTGGHNPIEAAAHGLPMLMGPARFQVEEICARFVAAECLHAVAGADDIVNVISALLADPTRRAAEGRSAQAVIARNRGAQAAVIERLCAWLSVAGADARTVR